MSPTEYIYFGAWFTALHKNPVFQAYLKKAFIIFIEKGYLG